MEVNYSRIRDIAGDDDDLIKTLLQLYIETFEKAISRMEASLLLDEADGDKKWHDANHELKGSSYNLGFMELGDYCKEIESIKGNKAKKYQVIDRLKDIMGDVMVIISKVDI